MNRKMLSYLSTMLALVELCFASLPTPIVMWHGMGDACCLPFSLGGFKTFLEEEIPGVYVKSIEIGSSIAEDIKNGYFMSPNKQIELVCEQLTADPHLKNGFNAIGFSQGSQFLRGAVQRCGQRVGPVRALVSLGGQHQGVYGLPNCASLKHAACNYFRKLLTHAAYVGWVQRLLVQATYWHDPLQEDEYKTYSEYLADINNERTRNQTYVDNLGSLEHFVMVKFEGDTVVEPKETEWFGYYVPGTIDQFQTLQQSDIYLKDRLGLKRMDEAGKLVFLSTPGNHLQFSKQWFIDNILKPYLLKSTHKMTRQFSEILSAV